jgi:hypothetical protein
MSTVDRAALKRSSIAALQYPEWRFLQEQPGQQAVECYLSAKAVEIDLLGH